MWNTGSSMQMGSAVILQTAEKTCWNGLNYSRTKTYQTSGSCIKTGFLKRSWKSMRDILTILLDKSEPKITGGQLWKNNEKSVRDTAYAGIGSK